MSSISVVMSYLFCEIDCRDDMWQNHSANIVWGMRCVISMPSSSFGYSYYSSPNAGYKQAFSTKLTWQLSTALVPLAQPLGQANQK